MTVTATNRKNQFETNGVTTDFAFTFAITDIQQVKALTILDGIETDYTNFTVVENVSTEGGTLTTGDVLDGVELLVYRDTALTQQVNYVNGGRFPADSHEQALDKLTLQNQDQQEEIDRSLKSSISDLLPQELGVLEDGKLVGVVGNSVETVDIDIEDAENLIASLEIALANAGYNMIGDFSDPIVPIENANDALTSTSVAGYEAFVWRCTAPLPYTRTGSDPTQAPELGNWSAVAIGELSTIARSLNVSDNDVIYDTDTATPIPGYIYAASQQKTYAVPVGAQGSQIVSVAGNQLTTNPAGDSPYTLVDPVTTALNSALSFSTVASLKSSSLLEGQRAATDGYYGGWSALSEPQGSAKYNVTSLQNVRDTKGDPAWIPDELGNHTLANGMIAMLDSSGFKVDILQFGAKNTLADIELFDSLPSIQAALDYLTLSDGINGVAGECFAPAGNYGVSSGFEMPSTIRFYGAGRFCTSFIAQTGFTGLSMLTDKGSAAKIQLEAMRFDARNAVIAITDIVKLGYGIPYGTEGVIRDILLRGGDDSLTSFSGSALNIVGNVGYIEDVTAEFCGNGFTEGPNSVACSYVNCTTIGTNVSGFSVNQSARIYGAHVEAPTATCIPFRVARMASLTGCSVSLANDNITEVVRLDAAATGINVNGLTMLRSGSGVETHMLNDLRSISSNSPFWADDATEQGSMYTFTDGGYIRVGTASHITQDVNNSLQLSSTSVKGSVYTEMIHDSASLRVSGSVSSIYPDPDNVLSLGFASRRFTEVFAVNPAINTSDKTEKTDFTAISDNLKAAALEVKGNIQLFRWISAVNEKGDKARIHAGVIAQEVHSIFESHGVDAFEYGIVGIDDITEDVLDDEGKITGQKKVGERWNVRPTEIMWLILSAI